MSQNPGYEAPIAMLRTIIFHSRLWISKGITPWRSYTSHCAGRANVASVCAVVVTRVRCWLLCCWPSQWSLWLIIVDSLGDLVGKFKPVFEWSLSERQVCWDLARNVVAGECLLGTAGLSCWGFEHTNTEQCARIRKGGLNKGQRQGARSWCMTASVFVAHTAPLCALSHAFPTTGFPTFLLFPLFAQTDLLLFATEPYSRCFEWHD